MLALVENLRRKQLAWFEAVLLHRNWNMSQLAEAAKVDPSTLSKFRRDPLNVQQLSTRVVARIEEASGIPAYQTTPPAPMRGFSEKEAEPLAIAPSEDLVARAIAAARAGRNGLDPWILRSRALENAGFMPGDILMVDLNAEPHDGDAVCVQVYDRQGKAETVMRIYEEPYLVAASYDPKLRRPLHLGKDQVLVRGVVVATFRPRRAA